MWWTWKKRLCRKEEGSCRRREGRASFKLELGGQSRLPLNRSACLAVEKSPDLRHKQGYLKIKLNDKAGTERGGRGEAKFLPSEREKANGRCFYVKFCSKANK